LLQPALQGALSQTGGSRMAAIEWRKPKRRPPPPRCPIGISWKIIRNWQENGVWLSELLWLQAKYSPRGTDKNETHSVLSAVNLS